MAGGDLPFSVGDRRKEGAVGDAADSMGRQPCKCRLGSEDPDKLGFPGFRWHPAKGVWARARKGRLSFFAKGGHVTACKIYREMAQEQGLVRTFTEKAKTKPNVRKALRGGQLVGRQPGLRDAKRKAAGMTHGLLNGRAKP